ncbi:hypothetical protein GVX82_02445 [Patescibacteria group bacterium]|jgi:hypothetical protein|nr:hypothetical protein [Patescibacteria group bacterium]
MFSARDKILTSIEPVIQRARRVSLVEEKVDELAREVKESPVPPWDNQLQFLGTPEETLQYYFLLDSINFCFWAKKGDERWSYWVDGAWMQGYYAYSRALKDAVERDTSLLEANVLSELSEERFRTIFQGKNELLLMPERWWIVRENFTILKDTFEGQAHTLVAAAQRDVNKLVSLLLEHFPTFRDVTPYDGYDVWLLKRAQIFCSDISFALPDHPGTKFTNLGDLTVFADYKLPQILESVGVLRYDDDLERRVREEELIVAGSPEEVEIRAFTIHAIELLRARIESLGRSLTTNEVDWILWVLAKQTSFEKPHHKTLTTFY